MDDVTDQIDRQPDELAVDRGPARPDRFADADRTRTPAERGAARCAAHVLARTRGPLSPARAVAATTG